jgi:hypothetical protein
VRLSDWLGPNDELVPFGPRAHAHAATREREAATRTADPDSRMEPPGSGFWDGDTSVHTAVPGPGIFDEPGERTADRHPYRRSARVWRPALPAVHPFEWASRVRERLPDLDRISWRWAAAGVAVVALVAVALVATLGGSSAHRDSAAQAGIDGQPRVTLTATLAETGTAARAAAVTELRRLPAVRAAVRTIGVATTHARWLQVRHRRPAVAPASVPSSAATGSVETTTPAPAETTSAPSPTEPVQTTANPAPTTSGGGDTSGGGASGGGTSDGGASGGGTSSGSQQSAFGAGGSLGPGSSPNG